MCLNRNLISPLSMFLERVKFTVRVLCGGLITDE